MRFVKFLFAPLVCIATIMNAQITNRIYTFGNSVTDGINFEGFQQIANQRGNTHILNRHMIPGAPLYLLYQSSTSGFNFSPFGFWPNALANYDWDAISFQPFDRGIMGSDGDFTAIQNWVNYIKANRPTYNQVQIYIYSRYPRVPSGFTHLNAPASVWNQLWEGTYSGGNSNETRQYFVDLLHTVRGANLLPKQAAIIPVGDVMHALNQKMIAGSVPGYNRIWDFYSDGIHVNNLGSFLLGATFFATLYKQDPRGLSVPSAYGSIPASIKDIILETIYEVVFTHPFSGTTLADIIPPTGISISPKNISLSFLQSASIIANITPSNASNKNVSWTSSNTSVATVDKNGKVTGVGSGTATITGTTNVGGFSDVAFVTVSGLASFTSVPGVLISWDFAAKPLADLGFFATQAMPGVVTTNGISYATIGSGLQIRSDGFGTGALMASDQNASNLSAAMAAQEYFTFRVKPAPGKLINVNRLKIVTKSEGDQHYYSLFSSVKGFVQPQRITTILGGFGTAHFVTITGHENLSQEVEFRVYVHSNTPNMYVGVGIGGATGTDFEIEGALVSPIDHIAPGTVPGLQVSQITDKGFFLSWNEATDNMIVMGYNIYLNGIKLNQSLIEGTNFAVSSLTSGLLCNVTVTAVDFVGNESFPSTLQTITNRPPTAVLQVSPTAGAAPLSVYATGILSTDPDVSTGDFVLGYDLNFGDGSPIVNANSATHIYSIPGVYTLSLVVVDTRNMRSTSVTSLVNVTATGSDITPPTAPNGVYLINSQSNSASIAWGSSVDNISLLGYNVFLNQIKLNASPILGTSYDITGLAEGQMYTVSVTAIDASGNQSAPVPLTFSTNLRPVATFTGLLTGSAPFVLSLNASASYDPDAHDFITEYMWTIGGVAYSGAHLQLTLAGVGTVPSGLRVKAQNGNISTAIHFVITVASIPVSGISISPHALIFPALQSRNVMAQVLPSNASNKTIVYTSNNPSVATVDALGRVYGAGTGLATITATAFDGNFKAHCMLTITSAMGATVNSGTLVGWEFSSITTSNTITTFTGSYFLSGIVSTGTSGLASLGSGLDVGGNMNGGFGIIGQDANDINASIAQNEYFSFRVRPQPGTQMTINALRIAPNAQGVRTFEIFSSRNGFTVGNQLVTTVSSFWCCGNGPAYTFPITGHEQLTHEVEFRVYLHFNPADGNRWEGVHIGPSEGFDFALFGSTLSTSDASNPSAPGNITVVGVTNQTATIQWTDATDDVAVVGYHIYRNGTRLTSTPINAIIYTLTGLSVNSTYNVSVTAVDVANKESAPSAITLMTNRIPTASITGMLTGTFPNVVTLSGLSSSDPDTGDGVSQYMWSVNGSAPIVGPVLQFVPATPGVVTVTLTVFDTRGGSSSPRNVLVSITDANDVTPPSTPGQPQLIRASGATIVAEWPSSFDTSPFTYRAVLNGITTIVSSINRVSFTGVNLTVANNVYVVAIDLSGNVSAASPTLHIPAGICTLSGISITGPNVYALTLGGSGISLSANITPTAWIASSPAVSVDIFGSVSAIQVGNAMVYAIYTQGFCSLTSTGVSITVHAPAAICTVSSIAIVPSQPITLTLGGAHVTLSSSVQATSWFSNSPAIVVNASGVVSAVSTGSGMIYAVYQEGVCNLTSSGVSIQVVPQPLASGTCSISGFDILTNSTSEWLVGQSYPLSATVAPVQWLVYGTAASLDTALSKVNVIATGTFTIAGIYHSNNCNLTKTITATSSNLTAIQEAQNVSYTIFPNPVADVLSVKVEGFKRIVIKNLSGSKILESFENVLDVSTLPHGIYLAEIHTSDGVFTKKVLK